MGSYKLYVAVMAIAVIAAVQEISCIDNDSEPYDDLEEANDTQEEINDDQGEVNDNQGEENNYWGAVNDKEEEVSVPEIEHHQCEEYKSKIWNDALNNPKAMDLMELTFNTAKELASDKVCSDTYRALFNFVDVMSTSPYAHYSLGMFNKMMSFIWREVDTTSDKFRETRQVFERISKTPEIRDYFRHTAAQIVELLRVPVNRSRLSKIIKAVYGMIKPSQNEELIKQKIKGLTNAPAKTAMGAIQNVGRLFRNF